MFNSSRFKKLALGSSLVFLAIVAVTLGSSQIYLMAIILGLVPVVLWLIGMAFLRGLTARRSAPETCQEGERVRINLTIENKGLLPKFFLRPGDRLPRGIRFAGEDQGQGSLILQLWPGESTEIGYYIQPRHRGLFKIGPTRVQMSDLVGFTSFHRDIGDVTELLAYPEVLPVRADFLSSGISRGWREEDRALTRGSGMDFDGVREYRSGDELRRVNWKTTARMGSLAVTEYTQGEANDVVIALDLEKEAYDGSGEGSESALEYGVKIAAAIAAAALRQGSSLRFITAANIDQPREPLGGIEQLPIVLDQLARAQAEFSTPIAEVLNRAVTQATPGATLVCITPRDSQNPALREALSAWRRAPASSSLSLFWLEREKFAKGREKGAEGPGASINGWTSLGREHFVSPDTSLISLLQEPSYARFGY